MKPQILLFTAACPTHMENKRAMVAVTRHQRRRWKSGNLSHSVDTWRGGTVFCFVFLMAATPSERTGTVNGSLSQTHLTTHTLNDTSFFFVCIFFDLHAMQILKLIIGQNCADHANFARVGGGGDKQQQPQLLKEACWGLQIVPGKLPKFTSSFGATSQHRRLFCPRSRDCNAALAYFAKPHPLLFVTRNKKKKGFL